jgi:RHS repeat-associated protein
MGHPRRRENEKLGHPPNNGQVSYTFDNVGNRLQRNSTLPAVPATGLLNYDANDRTAADPYDSDGNLLSSGAGTNVYDFENRLVQAGGVSIVYDGDGNRVVETVAGVTTHYLVAELNPTGYAQVIEEHAGIGNLQRQYAWGLQLISARDFPSGTSHYYGLDGHGSVRFLTSSTGAITDTYDYDAFGNLISKTGTTTNNYLFAGEQFDPALGIYYNRARYYDQRLGRFWTMDDAEGENRDPISLHKYLYANINPVNNTDPSGHDSIAEFNAAAAVVITLAAITLLQVLRTQQSLVRDLTNATGGAVAGIYDDFSYAAQRAYAGAELALGAFSLSVAELIEQAKDKIRQKVGRLKKLPKVIPIPAAIIPTIAGHIALAQAAGYPEVLTRCDPVRAALNRAVALLGLPSIAGYGLSWDEYPFASSYQGGAGSSVMGVPANEQFIQGGIIIGAYILEGISTGDQYTVVVF